MYQKTAAQTPPPGSGPAGGGATGGTPGQEPGGAGKKEDEVIDAEYVDMDDNK